MFVEHIRIMIPKRDSSVQELARNVLETLVLLKKNNNTLFPDWYEQANSKKEALEKKVSLDEEYLVKLIESSWDKKFPRLGCSFTLWTGNNHDLQNSEISFSLGKTTINERLKNRIVLSFPLNHGLRVKANDKGVLEIIASLKIIWGVEGKDIEVKSEAV